MFLLIGPEQGIARYDCGQHQSKLPPVAEVLHVRLRPREPSAQAGSRGRRLASEEGSGEQPPAGGVCRENPFKTCDLLRHNLAQRHLRDRELRREVVVKAAGLGGASGLNVARRSFVASTSWSRFDGLGIRGRLSPDRRGRKAREVRFHLVEDE